MLLYYILYLISDFVLDIWFWLILRQLLMVDKNLYKNEEHLKKILEGKCTFRLENLDDPLYNKNQTLNVLKRRVQMKGNQNNSRNIRQAKGVDMIGCGNTYDTKKVETLLAKQKYLTELIHKEKKMTQSRRIGKPMGQPPAMRESRGMYARQTGAVPGFEGMAISQSHQRNRGSNATRGSRQMSGTMDEGMAMGNTRESLGSYQNRRDSRNTDKIQDSLTNVAHMVDQGYQTRRESRRSQGYMSNSHRNCLLLFESMKYSKMLMPRVDILRIYKIMFRLHVQKLQTKRKHEINAQPNHWPKVRHFIITTIYTNSYKYLNTYISMLSLNKKH